VEEARQYSAVIGQILFVVFLWAAFALCAYNLLDAFKNGVVFVRTTEYQKAKSSRLFWFAVLANIPLTIMFFGLAILMTLGLFGLV
jgi:hypothetical protein